MTDRSTTKWSRGHRIWHWTSAAVVLGLLGTAVLRKTFLSYKANAVIIHDRLAAANTEIPIDAAKAIGRAIRAPMWQWHYYLGFVLLGLLLARVVLFFVRTDDHAFRRLSRLLRRSVDGTGRRSGTWREILASGVHVLFYAAVLVMVVGGVALYFKTDLGMSRGTAHAIKESHEVLTLFFAAFVALHVATVVRAELTDQSGIVSEMIHGGGEASGATQTRPEASARPVNGPAQPG